MIDPTSASTAWLWAQLAEMEKPCTHCQRGVEGNLSCIHCKGTNKVARFPGWLLIAPNEVILREAMKAEGFYYHLFIPPDKPAWARFFKLGPGWKPYQRGSAKDAVPLLACLLAATEALEEGKSDG